jgi:hypothetical protein
MEWTGSLISLEMSKITTPMSGNQVSYMEEDRTERNSSSVMMNNSKT